MSARLVFDKQESGIWTPVTGSAIAPNPPDAYDAIYEPDGTRFYIEGKLPYAGVCWKQANDLRQATAYQAPFHASVAMFLILDDAAVQEAEAIEVDLMYSDANGNVGNGSTHLNLEKGGIWEIIDPSGAWIATTFAPGIPAADAATPLMVTALFDPVKETSQIADISFGAASAVIDGPVLPFLKLAWGPNLIVNQLQPGLRKTGGAFSMKIRGMSTAIQW